MPSAWGYLWRPEEDVSVPGVTGNHELPELDSELTLQVLSYGLTLPCTSACFPETVLFMCPTMINEVASDVMCHF